MTELNIYGGALSGDCPWYVERTEDREVFDRLAHGESCYVLTSHQMGKSSLLVRLIENFRKSGVNAAAIDLTAFGRELSASQWYNALALRVGRELHLEDEFDAFWAAHKSLAPFEGFYRALEGIALRALPGPLILFVDEVDLMRSLPFSPDEFLTAVHGVAARADRDSPGSSRLLFCLFATVRPETLWRELKPGHLDLGRIILLRDFGSEELFEVIDGWARFLLERSKLSPAACLAPTKFVLGEILKRVFHWTRGHPYLTQKLGCVATHSISSQLLRVAEITAAQCQRFVDNLAERLFTSRSAREQDCHLLWVRHNLQNCGLPLSRVIELFHHVRSGLREDLVDDQEREALVSSGVIRVRDGYLEMRNRVYERLFDEGWLSLGPRAPGYSSTFALTPAPARFSRYGSGVPELAGTSGR